VKKKNARTEVRRLEAQVATLDLVAKPSKDDPAKRRFYAQLAKVVRDRIASLNRKRRTRGFTTTEEVATLVPQSHYQSIAVLPLGSPVTERRFCAPAVLFSG